MIDWNYARGSLCTHVTQPKETGDRIPCQPFRLRSLPRSKPPLH